MGSIFETLQTPAQPATTVTTTLYDLIATIHTEVGPDEDHVVVATVMHLLQSGRLRFLNGNS